MAGKVKPIPDGYHTTTPYLIVEGAANAALAQKTLMSTAGIFPLPPTRAAQ
jgi:hypothetical protein